MKFRVEVVCISDAGQEHRGEVLEMERHQLAMETLGLNLCESKAMLESVQQLRGRAAGCRRSGAAARLPGLWGSLPRQGRRSDRSEDTVWGGGSSQPALETLLVSAERAQDFPTHGGLAAGHNESGVAVRRDQVGLVDSVRQGYGFVA